MEQTLIRVPMRFHNRMLPKYGLVQLMKLLNDIHNQSDKRRRFEFALEFKGKGQQEFVMKEVRT